MTAFLDGLLVGAAFALSAAYVLFALGPRAWRRRGLERLRRLASRAPAALGMRAWLLRIGGEGAGGCAGCGSCADTAAAAPAAEVRVPLERIGRRP